MSSHQLELHPNLRTRREFFRQASCAAVGTWALTSTIRDLRLINSALAHGTFGTSYKALVCLFLSGGNDANNWIVPTDTTTFDAYTNVRGNMALPSSSLQKLYQTGTSGAEYSDVDGHTYGFHPSCTELRTLFGEDKLACLMNVGTLVRPTTKAQYNSNPTFYRPPQIFSHSDQVTQWQTSIPDQPPTTGWGGRVADLLNAGANTAGSTSMSVSLNGANTFEVGNLVAQYHVSTAGAVTLANTGNGGGFMTGTGSRVQAMKDIIGMNFAGPSQPNLQRAAYANVLDNAIFTGDLLNSAIASSVDPGPFGGWPVAFPNTGLGNQLKMIARLIHARGTFSMHRQIFFCSVGGYDTHTAQVQLTPTLDTTIGSHTNLLNEVSECVFAFQRAMEHLDQGDLAKPVSNGVTTFTASDFSRTFPTNSQGTDHGWGGHHIVVGGAVAGGQTYGRLPTFAINGPDDTSTGRWIPTLAVDQYAATLAKWFGVSTGDLSSIFPNLSRFSTSDLGFMT